MLPSRVYTSCVVHVQVAWHPVDAGLLASSSMDGSVVAFKADGTKVKVGAALRAQRAASSSQPLAPGQTSTS